MCMPSVLFPPQVSEAVTECFAIGQEVWRNGHRAFIVEAAEPVLPGETPVCTIKQGRQTFTCLTSELSSRRPQQ